jgi:hypothetical protein
MIEVLPKRTCSRCEFLEQPPINAIGPNGDLLMVCTLGAAKFLARRGGDTCGSFKAPDRDDR